MGFLTTFTVYNDGCDQLEKHPERLAKILRDACSPGFIRMNGSNQVGLGNHANLITVQETRHADSWALYLHAGNILTNVSEIDKDSSLIKSAITQLQHELKRLKKLTK